MKNNCFPLALTSFCSAILFFTGCKKSAVSTDIGVVKSFYAVQTQKVDGYFIISALHNSVPDSVPGYKFNAQVQGWINAKNINDLYGTAVIGGNIISRVPVWGSYDTARLSTDSLFGRNVNFAITLPYSTTATTANSSLYSPILLHIANNTPRFDTVSFKIGSTLQIAWNADPNNDSVQISANYTYKINDTLSTSIQNTIIVADKGNMALPTSFFSKFPAGGIVDLTVGRGNTMLIQKNNYKFQLSNYTEDNEFIKIGE